LILDQIEHLLSRYPSVLQALIATGTLAAVITSIAIALGASRANRTRLKVWLDIRKVVGGDAPADNPPRYLVASLTNKGNLTAHIEFGFFVWKIPFQKDYASINPLDYYGVDRYYPKRPYPVAIAPRSSHSACLSDFATFKATTRELAEECKWGRSLRMRFARAYVWTADGARFQVKISDGVRGHLIEAGSELRRA
jgi:hypothetical protein